MRESAIAFVKTANRHCLIISLSTREDSLVVKLNGNSGRPHHTGQRGDDVFDSEEEAVEHLRGTSNDLEITRGVALLGYVAVGNRGLVLLATRTRVCVTLPGDHDVKLVVGSKWLEFRLEGASVAGSALSKAEMDKLMLLREFTLDNAHYFCETLDITRPYPSQHHIQDPSLEFVWNLWLVAALGGEGLGYLCPHLLQGMAAGCTFKTQDGSPFAVALLSRRSCLHPGMRYIARGLNALAGPGNESEVEQLVWRPSINGGFEWSNFTWRRGTVPIWWGAEMKGGGFGDVGVSIKADRPFSGTKQYFRRLQKRFAPPADSEGSKLDRTIAATDPGQQEGSPSQLLTDPSRSFPVVCINLLRADPSKANDLLLSEHFAKGVRHTKKHEASFPVTIRNFDWHGMLKFEREQGTAEGLWAAMAPYVIPCGMARGHINLPGKEFDSGKSGVEWHERQSALLRYNCADSLDRTNAASYFIAVQVLVEQCRRLGLEITSQDAFNSMPSSRDSSSSHLPSRAAAAAASADTIAANGLPEGWEQRLEPSTGELFFLDHNTKQTFWEDSLPDSIRISMEVARGSATIGQVTESTASDSGESTVKPTAGGAYGLFGCSVSEVKKRLHPLVASEHATFFKVNGDMNAYLYTSSRAMHSEILNLLLPKTDGLASNAMGGIHKLNNLGITLQRRWSNVLSDAQRQQTVQLFLGLLIDRSLPSARALHPTPDLLQEESEDEEDDATPQKLPEWLHSGTEQEIHTSPSDNQAEGASSRAGDLPSSQMEVPPQLRSNPTQAGNAAVDSLLAVEPGQHGIHLLSLDSDHSRGDGGSGNSSSQLTHPLSLI